MTVVINSVLLGILIAVILRVLFDAIRSAHTDMRKKKAKESPDIKMGDWVVVSNEQKHRPCHRVMSTCSEPNCTYPIAWKWENEKELAYLYSREKLSHSMYVRMTDLEKRKEGATGIPYSREGSRARVEFMEREAAADNERMRRIVQQEVRAELNRIYSSVDKVPKDVR